MRPIKKFILFFVTLFFIGCGENTDTPLAHLVTSIEINETNLSIYSTDIKQLGAIVYFDDNTSADITDNIYWYNSEYNATSMLGGEISGGQGNGGESNISIEYENFSDSIIVHVKELISINYSDINMSDTTNLQIIKVSGNFENNETNITMYNNIYWTSDENSTINESNTTQIELTLHDSQTLLIGTYFEEEFCHPITKELLSINYSDINASDINSTQIVYITGNYENNELNARITNSLIWSSDENATIGETNSTQIELTIHNNPTNITATIFNDTSCAKDFNKTIESI